MVLGQTFTQEFKGFFWTVRKLEEADVLGRNRSGIDECLKIQDTMPVLAAINHDQNLLCQFISLSESQNLEELVHGAEAAGKDDQSLSQIGEPELTHEKVVKLKV